MKLSTKFMQQDIHQQMIKYHQDRIWNEILFGKPKEKTMTQKTPLRREWKIGDKAYMSVGAWCAVGDVLNVTGLHSDGTPRFGKDGLIQFNECKPLRVLTADELRECDLEGAVLTTWGGASGSANDFTFVEALHPRVRTGGKAKQQYAIKEFPLPILTPAQIQLAQAESDLAELTKTIENLRVAVDA